MSLVVLASLLAIFALTMYVLLDGFDLGIGCLLLMRRDEGDRDAMIASIAPVWDGNETWLVLLGVTLLAGFPLAYGTLLPAVYLPLILMLVALGFRGVSFEFRGQAAHYRRLWDGAFAGGSIVASLCQGLMLGIALKGVPEEQGGLFAFITGFNMLTAVAVLAAYVLLGAAWLHWRTDMQLRHDTTRQLRAALLLVAIHVCAVIAVMIRDDGPARSVWASDFALSWGFGLAAAALCLLCGLLAGRAPGLTRACASGLVALLLAGAVVSIWPYIVPFKVTIWEAASPTGSQRFVLIGAMIMLPLVLANAVYIYRTFRRVIPGDTARSWDRVHRS